jgi:hypothetical protein
MRSGDKVLVQAWVPKWVRDSLQHEAAKEQRSVSNLLAKWLAESCEPVPEKPQRPAQGGLRYRPHLQDISCSPHPRPPHHGIQRLYPPGDIPSRPSLSWDMMNVQYRHAEILIAPANKPPPFRCHIRPG